ncbi:DNA-binding protein [Legionella erythra]|uniref:DNA-binding protein n=1 Tax=Legionella erythra TaxID=448 RepID=UPI001ED99BB3|nr:DNA-binding protein [Legionella erythra]
MSSRIDYEKILLLASVIFRGDYHGTLANRTPGPKYIKIGRSVRYLKDDLDSWLDLHRK